MAQNNDVPDFAVDLTCRSKLKLLHDIKRNFSNTNKDVLFRRTCFGWLFDLAEMQETCILLHYISLCQEEPAEGDTDVVPLTYHVRGYELKFGREEFCLVTGLRFGVEFKDHFKGRSTPFRRRVFSSGYDSCNITAGMVYNKLYSDDFDKLSDNDAVRLSLVGMLVLVLLGLVFNYKVDNWIMSLVDNLDAWNIYPWGNVVWRTLYNQLAGAVGTRLEAFYATPQPPPNDKGKVKNPKYTLMGFQWAFKTWILESYRVGAVQFFNREDRYPRACAWCFKRRFKRHMLDNFLETIPILRLFPDVREFKEGWWVHSIAYFEGRCIQPPPIPPPTDPYSRDDVPEEIYRQLTETQKEQQALKDKLQQHETLIQQLLGYLQPQQKGVSGFTGFVNSKASPAFHGPPNSSFFHGMSHPSPQVASHFTSPFFNQQMSHNNATSFTPMPQQGFAPWSGINMQEAGPSHAPVRSRVIPAVMNREKRDVRPGPWQKDPFGPLPDTTVIPKKRVGRRKNIAHTADIPPLDFDDANDSEVVITRATYTGDCLSFYNVDPNKVERFRDSYPDFRTFLLKPEYIFLDCHIKGHRCEPKFWIDLLPFEFDGNNDGWLSDDHINVWMELQIRHRKDGDSWTVAKSTLASCHAGSNVFILITDKALQGTLNGRTRPYPSWDQVDMVFMPIHCEGNHWVVAVVSLLYSTISVFDSLHSEDRRERLHKHMIAWTTVLNESLDIQGYFQATKRQPYNFFYTYNDSQSWFPTPQQANSMDCGVITCRLITQFRQGNIPPPHIPNPLEFFKAFRYTMAYHLYDTRCENTQDCGYD